PDGCCQPIDFSPQITCSGRIGAMPLLSTVDHRRFNKSMTALSMPLFESKHQNPGFISLLCFDQGGCHERSVGVESIATQQPLSRDTIFDLASVSKQFTAFCLLLLEQDGRLSLSDPVSRFVPEV
ncbi:putative Alkaline D-peptidase, partial [Pseudomonas syringae pv. maculicola]